MKIKGILIFILFYFFTSNLYCQIDSLSERLLYTWTINPFDLNLEYSDIDTTLNDFQKFNPLLKSTITNNYLGNLGSAVQSNVYYDRRKKNTYFLFSEPYAVYFHLPYDHKYFNTKRQFTLLSYGSGGPREESEQTLGLLHTQNVTEDFNVGIDYDLISSAGRYQDQKTQIHAATIFSSYRWNGYRVHANYTLNKVNNEENGGIDSLWYLGSKEYSRSQTIPVKMSDAYTTVNSSNLYLVQEYQFGKIEEIVVENNKKSDLEGDIKKTNREKKLNSDKEEFKSRSKNSNDSLKKEGKTNLSDNIKDTLVNTSKDTLVNTSKNRIKQYLKPNGFSVSHELFYNKDFRKFSDKSITEDNFYKDLNSFINASKTNDAVFQNRFGNTLSVHYRYKQFFSTRLSYYNEQITYENNIIPDTLITYDSEDQPKDTTIKRYLLNNYSNNNVSFYISGLLFKRIHFQGSAEYYLNGLKKGNSSIYTLFGYRLFGNNWIEFKGNYSNQRPDYFYKKFTSNHFRWNNKNLIRLEEWDGNVIISNKDYRFEMSLGYGQITGHVYLDTAAIVQQYGSQINILSATLNKKFTLGPFHSNTQFVYQTSTNDSILSLPELNLFQSLYYEKLFKFSSTGGELRMQAGIDYRYSSSYMGDQYMPITGLFYRQFEQKLADYQCLDIFINFAIKRARFYLVYNYLNSALNNSYFFTSPYYPAPPALFKFGLAWTFYD